MVPTWKNGPHWDKMVKLVKMGHTWKSGSQLENRVTLGTTLSARNLSSLWARETWAALYAMIMRYNLTTPSNELATDLLTVRARVFKPTVFCHGLPIVCRNSINEWSKIQSNGGLRGDTSFAARNRFIWCRKITSVKAKILRYGLELNFWKLMADFQKFFWRKQLLRTEVRWLKDSIVK